MDDVLLNKAAIMERCLRRVVEEYAGTPSRCSRKPDGSTEVWPVASGQWSAFEMS
jgi:hypothetical protein